MWQDLARAGIMVGRGQDNSDDGEDNGEVIEEREDDDEATAMVAREG